MAILEQLAEAKMALGKARELLAHPAPETLWDAAGNLEQAVSKLRMMAAGLGKTSSDSFGRLDAEFRQFRDEVRVTGALLGQLGGYFAVRTAATYSCDGKFDMRSVSREPRELLRA
jgi:hypothetical protein